MFRYSPEEPEILVLGALHLETLGDGSVRPHRLPAASMHRIPTKSMHAMVATAAGVRVCFATAADRIEVELRALVVEIVGGASQYSTALDLVIDGEVFASQELDVRSVAIDTSADQVTFAEASPMIVSFDRLPLRNKLVEVWLPHNAVVDLCSISTSAPITESIAPCSATWLHHGSSISHCLEATRPTRTWPAIAARERGWALMDLGFAGNAQLDPFVARVIRDTAADLITLKLGINVTTSASMRMRTFVPAVHGFLDTIRDGHPATPIVLISPIICPVLEDHAGPIQIDSSSGTIVCESAAVGHGALTLTRVRSAFADIVTNRAIADPNLFYLDGRALFDHDDVSRGYLPDGLHPNVAGYELMGRRFARLLPSLVGQFESASRASSDPKQSHLTRSPWTGEIDD